MLLDYVQTGLVWYYMNILAVAGIIYMILKLAVVRAQRAAINTAETRSTSDKIFLRFVMFAATFGIVFFLLREYINQIEMFWDLIADGIKEIKNG